MAGSILAGKGSRILHHAAADEVVTDLTVLHGQHGIAMDNSGVPTFSDNTAGHDLALDFGITADGHAAGHILGIGTQHGAAATIGQAAADDGGAEIDAADDIRSAVGRGKGTAGDVHGSSTVVGDRNRTVPAVVVGHTAAHHGGMEFTARDSDVGTLRSGVILGAILASLDVVAAHDQFVAIVLAFLTEGTTIDGQARLAGGQGGVRVIGDFAATHHEFGGRTGLDGSADIAERDIPDLIIIAAHIAAADDFLDGAALDGEGDVARSGHFRNRDIPFVQVAAHEMIGIPTPFQTATPQSHIACGGRHAGAAHDQHAGHGQAAESVHQVALFEHRLVPVDQIPDGSLGKLHNSISRICDVRPTTGVRCTGRLSGRETESHCK